MLSGKKTYLAAAALAVFAITGLVTGNLTADQAIAVFLNALAVAGLRSAISKQ
jgi:hypothetical protein